MIYHTTKITLENWLDGVHIFSLAIAFNSIDHLEYDAAFCFWFTDKGWSDF